MTLSVWDPVDLAAACPASTSLMACTYFGYIYLNLVAKLYGGAADVRIQKKLAADNPEYQHGARPSQYQHSARPSQYQHSARPSQYQHTDVEEYDFIVVGAGAAGCVVANRLTEISKWKVLLLEAGPEQPDVTLVPGLSTVIYGTNIDWQYKVTGNGKSCLAYKDGACPWPRGKMMGGSSSINAMVYIRGNKLDYDTWAAMGNVGWSFRDVLPFFKKSEKNLNIEAKDVEYHGSTGQQSVARYPFVDTPSIMLIQGFNQLGLPIRDFNAREQLGTMISQNVAENGMRVSTNTAFIQPIRYSRPNLVVRTNAEARKILIDDQKRAYGIQYVVDGKSYTAVAKREVILSAGAINTPKLMLLSGIGPKKQLEELNIKVVRDLPVGENLHDHPTFLGLIVSLPNYTNTMVSKEEMLNHLYEYKKMQIHKGPLSGNGPVSSIAFTKSKADLPAPDLQFQVDNANWRELVAEPVTYQNLKIFPTGFYDAVLPRAMNLVPKSRGYLRLNTTDVNGPPILYPNYFDDESDLEPLIAGAKFAMKLEKTKSFTERGAKFVKIPLPACNTYEWGTEEYWRCCAIYYTDTTYHPVGTCKMGPKYDPTAVVDPRLKVYGVERLRVIDASIMPVVPRGNTNCPSIMVGEKGVSMLKEDWGIPENMFVKNGFYT